jgi:hypothetical protein
MCGCAEKIKSLSIAIGVSVHNASQNAPADFLQLASRKQVMSLAQQPAALKAAKLAGSDLICQPLQMT